MKTKRNLLFVLSLTLSSIMFGQVTEGEKNLRNLDTDSFQGWKKGGVMGLNLSQTSLTNWASGGQNSFAVNGLFSVFANYKNETTAWDNSLDLGYGLLKQGVNSDFMKTNDKFDFLSKYGRKAFDNVFYAAMLNFKTQMTEGKDYARDTAKISNFLAPAYIIGAIGMDYKPDNYFSVFLAPLTGKITLVNNKVLSNAGAFGVDPGTFDSFGTLIKEGKRSKSEFGGYIRVIYSRNDFKNEILKNVSFTTKLDFFSNYLKNPQNIDVNWETQLALQVNKFITVNLNTHLIYDDDIKIAVDNDGDGITDVSGPRVQFKEILGVGVTYTF